MQKRFIYTYFKKAICCLAFFFSFIFSFSSIGDDHHVRLNFSDETSINSDQLDYYEFSLSSIGHLSELPENPAEGESNTEIENEKENETDDDKDELIGYFNIVEILANVFSRKESYLYASPFFSKGTLVPFYILFHSWKSFLV